MDNLNYESTAGKPSDKFNDDQKASIAALQRDIETLKKKISEMEDIIHG